MSIEHDQEVGLYRYPPVDPITGEVSAADDSILMGQMRHCDVPRPHRKDGCTAIMHDHGWKSNGTPLGVTVCPPDLPKIARVLDGWNPIQREEIEELAAIIEQHGENDDWEWCLGDAEIIYKAGYRRVCGPVEQPF